MRQMDFLSYTQRPYTNVTVRMGYKWADLKIGEVITLTDNGRPVGCAMIRMVQVKEFRDIKPEDIKREHDLSCTTKTGLRRAMKKAYPDFSDSDVVTIVTYIIGARTK